jgi:hypothetical protein
VICVLGCFKTVPCTSGLLIPLYFLVSDPRGDDVLP